MSNLSEVGLQQTKRKREVKATLHHQEKFVYLTPDRKGSRPQGPHHQNLENFNLINRPPLQPLNHKQSDKIVVNNITNNYYGGPKSQSQMCATPPLKSPQFGQVSCTENLRHMIGHEHEGMQTDKKTIVKNKYDDWLHTQEKNNEIMEPSPEFKSHNKDPYQFNKTLTSSIAK